MAPPFPTTLFSDRQDVLCLVTETDELLVLDSLVEPGRLEVLVALFVSIRAISSHPWDANLQEEEELKEKLVTMLDERLEELVWVAEIR